MSLLIQSQLTFTFALAPANLWRIRGDDEVAKYQYKSRTAAEDWGWGPQTPEVYRFAPSISAFIRDPEGFWGTGDYRVPMTPLESQLCALNGEASIFDPKTSYLVSDITGLYNNTGWDKQAYISTSNNVLMGTPINGFLEFETLTPVSNVSGMTNETHPHLVHKFGLVGITAASVTYHTWNTPRGIVYYYLTSKEGKAYIPLDYVEKL